MGSRRAQPVILFADRDIFAEREVVAVESVAALVIVRIAVNIVVDRPVAAGFSDEVSDLGLFIPPEARGPAFAAMRLPLMGVEQVVRIDGATNS